MMMIIILFYFVLFFLEILLSIKQKQNLIIENCCMTMTNQMTKQRMAIAQITSFETINFGTINFHIKNNIPFYNVYVDDVIVL